MKDYPPKHIVMKRTLLIATAALLLLAASSCQKDQDGVYNPKKKISKISSSSSATPSDAVGYSYDNPMLLNEQWTWDGDKLVSRTMFNADGEAEAQLTYSYDGKRLTSIAYTANGYFCKTDFSYDGKKLSSAEHYSDGRHYCSVQFSHTDGKISAIDISYHLWDEKNVCTGVSMLDMLLPLDIQMSEVCRQVNAKGELESPLAKNEKSWADNPTSRIELTWDGNNITKMVSTLEGDVQTGVFTYDDKRNPFCGMGVMYLHLLVDIDDWRQEPSYFVYDRNNVLTCEYTHSSARTNTTYTYTYEDDYPTTCTVNWMDEHAYRTFRYQYEYLN